MYFSRSVVAAPAGVVAAPIKGHTIGFKIALSAGVGLIVSGFAVA